MEPLFAWLHTYNLDAGFLHTWDNRQDEGAPVAVYTNKRNDGVWIGNGWQTFEPYTAGMSWRFRPTPEYAQWKAKQKESGACCLSCTGCPKCQQAIKDSESAKKESEQASDKLRAQLDQREQALAKREENLGIREGQCEEKEKQIGPREEEIQQREAAMKQHEEDLAKQEQKVKQGEERLKKSKKGGAAEHLETQQKADNLTEENERLQKELEAAKASVDEAKEQLRLQKQQQGSRASHRSGGIPPSIIQPRMPGAGLSGYSKGQMERFQAVQKATSVN
ncbi:hypothetical protein KC345_g5203 [Hortaea werneckii]|nr:hypothetical protein KC345_g5203 [Hortaea werneckii]